MQLMDAIQHFLSELQRRKVLRVLSGYVIGAWIVPIQVCEATRG